MCTIIRLNAAFLMLIALLTVSCQEEVIAPNPPVTNPPSSGGTGSTNNPANSFYAEVDGVEFQETLLSASENPAGNNILITASENGSFPSIGLGFPNDVTPGTYPFTGFLGDYTGIYNIGTGSNEMFYGDAGSGNLVITTHDQINRYVEGTFSFTAVPMNGSPTPTYAISAGTFVVSY